MSEQSESGRIDYERSNHAPTFKGAMDVVKSRVDNTNAWGKTQQIYNRTYPGMKALSFDSPQATGKGKLDTDK